MRFVVGLGNPGEKYAQTRHNVGFQIIDQLASALDAGAFSFKDKFQAEIIKKNDVVLIKPQTYMNLSGQAVRSVINFFQIDEKSKFDNIFVVHDDLDIQLGKFKIQFGTGPKVHHGLQSIYQSLKTDQFWHIRVGIDGRDGDRTIPGDVYVLQDFSATEENVLSQSMNQVVSELIKKIT